jgi:sulfur carrier protein ThiS
MIAMVDGERVRAPFKAGQISRLLSELKIPREEVLVKVNGKLAPEDAEISASDRVEIIKVVFGG